MRCPTGRGAVAPAAATRSSARTQTSSCCICSRTCVCAHMRRGAVRCHATVACAPVACVLEGKVRERLACLVVKSELVRDTPAGRGEHACVCVRMSVHMFAYPRMHECALACMCVFVCIRAYMAFERLRTLSHFFDGSLPARVRICPKVSPTVFGGPFTLSHH